MTDDAHAADPEPTNSSLDFDQIKAEIDSLDTEIREAATGRLEAQAVIKHLSADEERLSRIVREWRFQPAKVAPNDLAMTERLCYGIYETLEEELPRFPSLWRFYRQARGNIGDGYGQAMEAISIFREILSLYERRTYRDRPLSEIGDDAAAMSSTRRKMIDAVRRFDEMLAVLVKRLAAADTGGQRR